MNMSIPPAPRGRRNKWQEWQQKPILPWNYLCGRGNTLVSRTRIAKETCGRLVCITVKEAREDDPNRFYRRLWKRACPTTERRADRRVRSPLIIHVARMQRILQPLREKREDRILSGYRRHSRCVTSNVPTRVQHPDVIVILRRYDLPKDYADIYDRVNKT